MSDQKKARAAAKPRRSQEERSAASRASLLESAIRHMRERGLAATNMTVIASEANLTRGAIQHHFSNRAELLLAVIGELDARISRAMDDYVLDADVTGLDRLIKVLDKVIALTSSDDNVAVYDLWSASRSDAALGAETLELQRQLTEQFRGFWRGNLEGHIPEDLIDASFDVTLTMSQGAAVAQLLNQSSETVDRMLAATKAMLLEFVKARLQP
ncbi:TetR/AcrR family transcriptional regulator [Sphingobium sp. AN558]|uniref:TetR/AcrR family transcriptional regulator n=1 Tax=Sphingobium sp. AN558 TaxID=3133442 RepID=UPI0030C62CC1